MPAALGYSPCLLLASCGGSCSCIRIVGGGKQERWQLSSSSLDAANTRVDTLQLKVDTLQTEKKELEVVMAYIVMACRQRSLRSLLPSTACPVLPAALLHGSVCGWW